MSSLVSNVENKHNNSDNIRLASQFLKSSVLLEEQILRQSTLIIYKSDLKEFNEINDPTSDERVKIYTKLRRSKHLSDKLFNRETEFTVQFNGINIFDKFT